VCFAVVESMEVKTGSTWLAEETSNENQGNKRSLGEHAMHFRLDPNHIGICNHLFAII
jgi:hypothetical protein